MRWWAVWWAVIGAMVVSSWAAAADPADLRGRRVYELPETGAEVVVDGRIDEPAWQAALRLELEYEVEPGENIAPPVRTEVFITSSQDAVLVAFRCHDPDPTKIRARYWDRDQLFADDWIGIMFDTFNDQRRAYEFVVNPLGVQMDAVNDDVGGHYDRNWNAIWSSAGRLTDFGWEAEIAVPFHQIRFPAVDGPQTWGMDVFRSYPRGDRHHIGLFPRKRGANSYLGQADKMVGFAGATPGRDLQITPTVIWSESAERSRMPDGPLATTASDAEAGVTARWGISSDLSLSAAANPDFSQVEADVIQLEVNETFSLFYPETRPFFLDGADTFTTPLNLVHTRMVADPSMALKLTGKEGRHSFGVFSAVDEVTTLIVPGAQASTNASFDLRTTASAGRYRYDLGGSSTVGLLMTDRRGGDFASSVAEADVSWRLSDADKLIASAAFSDTEVPQQMAEELGLDERVLDDRAFRVSYHHSVRSWNAWASYKDFGADFRSDLGFNPRVGFWQAAGGGAYILWGDEGELLRRVELGGDYRYAGEARGALLVREAEVWGALLGPYQSELTLELMQGDEVYQGVRMPQDQWQLRCKVRPSGSVNLGFSVAAGDRVDYEHARPATGLDLDPWLELTMGRHLKLNLSYRHSELEVDQGWLYRARVAYLRGVVQLNRRSFVRAVVQLLDVRRNTALYDDQATGEEQELFTQLLYAYEINSQTVLYAGYSDRSEGADDYQLTRANRSYFFKLGYAFLF